MAVAEKTMAVEATSRNPRQILMVHGALGALYVLASLWLVFVGLPAAWGIFNVAGLFNNNVYLADALLVLVIFPAIFGVFLLGRYLEGPHPVHGLRACAFYLCACTIGFGLLITCGVPLGSVIGIVLLVAAIIMYFQPPVLGWLVRLEEQGWFHAVAFKSNQGKRVRVGTVIAVMVIVLFGIFTLIRHASLETGSSWQVAGKLFPADPAEVEALRAEMAKLQKSRAAEIEGFTRDLSLEAARQAVKAPSAIETQRLEVLKRLTAVQRDWVTITDPWVVTMPFGKAQYVFMYHISLTVPLLLLVVSGWFAWRLVNWPTFGDFLIATEAEMNKVSWTTRRRLVQDTIVVLVTVVLLTVFLFVLDVVWIKVLTNPVIQVLKYDTQEAVRKNQSGAQW